MEHEKVLKFLTELRNAHPVMHEMFRYGSCLNLYCMLKVMFPLAKCYYSQELGHVATKIGDRLYDITGHVREDKSYQLIFTIWTNKYKTEQSLYGGEMYAGCFKHIYKRTLE